MFLLRLSTCVPEDMPDGMDIRLCFSQMAVCLPFLQMQEHIEGHELEDWAAVKWEQMDSSSDIVTNLNNCLDNKHTIDVEVVLPENDIKDISLCFGEKRNNNNIIHSKLYFS